jgi:two-component system response regulator PilR (NtrC family)
MELKLAHAQYEILVVDDDPNILAVNNDILVGEGYNVTTAGSGENAIEVLGEKRFDLVITDINMGPISGISVLKKAKELNPETMVIVTTGNTDVNYAIEALRLDADDYLLKPVRMSELLERVAHCLN